MNTAASRRFAAVGVFGLCTALLATSPVSAQSTYYGVATMLSQTDAEAACAADGNNLASMHSNEDHLLVIDACNAVSDTGNCWIGLSDAAVEGTWAWTDGTPVDYENWNAGEPNAWGAGPERCVAAAVEDPDGCASVDISGTDAAADQEACQNQGECTYYAAGDDQPSIPEQFNTGNLGDAALSPEDGVNILGLVSDTGDPVDASDDGKWNDADPSQPRAYVCSGLAPLTCTPVANADATTLTCTTTTDSQVTACATGYSLCESGGSNACVDGSTPNASADTCVPNPTCGNIDDDDDGGSEADDAFSCPDGDVLKPDPNSITCAAATCTAADCCNPSCGDVDNDGDGGSEDDDAFALADCDTGLVLKSNPLTIGCASGTCTSDDCCEAPESSPAATAPTTSTSSGRVDQAATMAMTVLVLTIVQ